MTQQTLAERDRSWLDDHAREWVDAGLISADQATSIKQFEHIAEPETPLRLNLVTEVASYVGSVLALMGGMAVVGPTWSDLGLFARLGVAASLMLVGFAIGTWLTRVGEAGTFRLGSFLWAVGTGGVAVAMISIIQEFEPGNEALTAFLSGLSILAVSVGLWRNLERPLPLVTTAVGFAVALAGLADMTNAPVWIGGVVLLVGGFVMIGTSALRLIRPHDVALAIGAFSAYIGGFMLGDLNEHIGPAAALAVAFGVLGYALHGKIIPLLALGVVGSLIATQALLATTFTGAVSALIVSVIGLAIVAVAIIRVRGLSA